MRASLQHAVLLSLGAIVACGPTAPDTRAPEVFVAPAPVSTEPSSTTPEAGPAESTPATSPAASPLGLLDRARVESTRAEAQSIAAAVELWQVSQGGERCPRFEDLVRDRVLSPDSSPLDPWRQPYTIACTDTGVSVTSNGPDKEPDTEDDVTSASQ